MIRTQPAVIRLLYPVIRKTGRGGEWGSGQQAAVEKRVGIQKGAESNLTKTEKKQTGLLSEICMYKRWNAKDEKAAAFAEHVSKGAECP